MHHLRRYFGALAVALAAYGLYALLAVPWLEPLPPARAAGGGDYQTGSVGLDPALRELFEPGSWELDDPKIVETAQCMLLLKDYQPLPDGRMEINPCTLIFFTAPSPAAGEKGAAVASSRRAIVMRAPQGAVLQFDRPLDVGRASVGRLMEGTLRGQIHLFSPPSAPGTNDALDLKTRYVKIDREKIYTPSVVDFRYGASFGSGRDLTITLVPEDKENRKRSPSVGGLSVLQLARVERLHLEGSASGMLPGTPTGLGATPPSDLPLEVRCEGPLVIDFEQNLAALDEKVEIRRVYPQGLPDRLTCDRLIFHLADRHGAGVPQGKGAKTAAPSIDAGQLVQQVERAIAIGSPVVLDAPQAFTFAKAARVEYLAASKRIALESGPSAPQVTLRRMENEFVAREIEYELAEPGRLGRLWAAGPGRLKFVPADGGQTLQAAWQNELTIVPHDNNKVVSLKGRPLVQFGAAGSFSAREFTDGQRVVPGEIYLWVLEVPDAASPAQAAVASAAPGQPPQNAKEPAPRYVIVPDRMLATGQVEIDTPQLAAHTRELQTWFVNQPAPAKQPSPSGAMFDPVPQPRNQAADSRPKLQKLDLSGNLIQLQILRRGNDSAVENLAISGQVKVKELVTGGPAAPAPLELAGEMVTLRQWTSEGGKLEIHGTPARDGKPAQYATAGARGLSLSGETIHLRRADNRLWIPGPGEAILPMPIDDGKQRPLVPPQRDVHSRGPAPVSGGLVPPYGTSAPTRPLKVTWREAFEFDGQKGLFSGAIEARGQAEFAAAEELSFTLNQRIDFSAPRQEGPVEVARLELHGGNGDVTMQRVLVDEQGKRIGVDNARVRNLVIDRTTGKISAAGPGEVWTVRRDLTAVPGGGLAPTSKDSSGKLAYVCVTFQGQIQGDLNRRQIEFQREVDTIYGQVSGWSERIVATRAEDLGESGVHVLSDTLKVTQMEITPAQKWVEIDAVGNSRAEGMKFFARGARIGYTSDKDQLVIAGDGRVSAEFWYRSEPGAADSHMEAGRFIFQRGTNSLQVDDALSIDISRLPRDGKPAPKLR